MAESEFKDGKPKPDAAPPVNPSQQKGSLRHWLTSLVILVIVGWVLLFEIQSRVRSETALRAMTAQMAVPAVSVVHPTPTAPAQEIILPGNIQPYISSPIYARTDGYLKNWYFDIGAHVKAKELLAVIETPEVDQQLAQARSTLATAQANLELARITMDRYAALLKKHAVSQQDSDNAAAAYEADKAIVDADNANVLRYETLVSFEKVYAPFDGVITARNTDIGDLINSGSSNAPKTDLFHISQSGILRVYVNVPEEYSRGIIPGKTASEIFLAEFPGRQFRGELVRTADAINVSTRTLLAEIDVVNSTNTLLTGSFAEVHLQIPGQGPTYLLPVNTLIFRSEGLQVAVVKDGKVALTRVTPGHDLGAEIEILAGLKADDQVVLNPPDSIVASETVQIVNATLPGDIK